MTEVRVLIVDDHPVVRAGLRALLTEDPELTVIGECGDGASAVRSCQGLRPDVVLMDLKMPGVDGVAATAEVTALGSRVVVLTTFDTDRDILRAIEAGATSYLLKDAPGADLVRAIHAAARGESVLAAPVATRLVSAVRRPTLTDREVEILRLVALGRSNVEISATLQVTPATVKSHLGNLFAKLDVTDRTAAVIAAQQRGWLA
ncbi:MAG TPA: response regulator transcription factor [Pseudonocardiaceae bacterium]|jgi:DNA-binding NarL/FixJ family response regulator